MRHTEYEYESFNENLNKWSKYGVPDDKDYNHIHYECKFCPSVAEEPEEIEHNRYCPCADNMF